MEHETFSSTVGPAYALSAPFGLPRNFRTVVQDFPADLATGATGIQRLIAAHTNCLNRPRMDAATLKNRLHSSFRPSRNGFANPVHPGPPRVTLRCRPFSLSL